MNRKRILNPVKCAHLHAGDSYHNVRYLTAQQDLQLFLNRGIRDEYNVAPVTKKTYSVSLSCTCANGRTMVIPVAWLKVTWAKWGTRLVHSQDASQSGQISRAPYEGFFIYKYDKGGTRTSRVK